MLPAGIMKQSTRKSSSLTLVPSASEQATAQQHDRTAVLKDSFDGWLNSVAPTLMQPPAQEKPEVVARGWRPLTSIDIVRVNRATIRESSVPRHWPPDVVLSFLAAEVIKPNKQ